MRGDGWGWPRPANRVDIDQVALDERGCGARVHLVAPQLDRRYYIFGSSLYLQDESS